MRERALIEVEAVKLAIEHGGATRPQGSVGEQLDRAHGQATLSIELRSLAQQPLDLLVAHPDRRNCFTFHLGGRLSLARRLGPIPVA